MFSSHRYRAGKRKSVVEKMLRDEDEVGRAHSMFVNSACGEKSFTQIVNEAFNLPFQTSYLRSKLLL